MPSLHEAKETFPCNWKGRRIEQERKNVGMISCGYFCICVYCADRIQNSSLFIENQMTSVLMSRVPLVEALIVKESD